MARRQVALKAHKAFPEHEIKQPIEESEESSSSEDEYTEDKKVNSPKDQVRLSFRLQRHHRLHRLTSLLFSVMVACLAFLLYQIQAPLSKLVNAGRIVSNNLRRRLPASMDLRKEKLPLFTNHPLPLRQRRRGLESLILVTIPCESIV